MVNAFLAFSNAMRRRLLEVLYVENSPVSATRLSEATSISPAEVHNHMQVLIEANFAEREKGEPNVNNFHVYYKLTDAARHLFTDLEHRGYGTSLEEKLEGFGRAISLLGLPKETDRTYKKGLQTRLAILAQIYRKRESATPTELRRSPRIRRWVKDPAVLSYHLRNMSRVLDCKFVPGDRRKRSYSIKVDSDIYGAIDLLSMLQLLSLRVD
jgi:DNA-binding transcriptional ArsR family regulator